MYSFVEIMLGNFGDVFADSDASSVFQSILETSNFYVILLLYLVALAAKLIPKS